MSLPPERRRQLQQLGLRALLKRRFGDGVVADASPLPFAGGAALLVPAPARVVWPVRATPVAAPEGGGGLAAVFADSTSGLGAAVDLAHREGADRLCFFAELSDGATARRAAEFAIGVAVIDPDGDFEVLAPAPHPALPSVPPELARDVERLRGAGLDPEWEHGVLTGEWLGLEVARVTPGRFEVGVGHHDREANALLYPDGIPDQFLDQAVATVRELRRPGAMAHPANQLATERWLRSVLVRRPDVLGFGALRSAAPPQARDDLAQRAVAPAVADDGTVVVCSAGVDPDLVAQAADARQLHGDGPLVIVVPEGDDHPLTRRLAALLRRPAEVRTVPPGWRAMATP